MAIRTEYGLLVSGIMDPFLRAFSPLVKRPFHAGFLIGIVPTFFRKAGSGRVDPDGDAGRAPRRWCQGLLRQNGHVGQVAKTPAITLASMASGARGLSHFDVAPFCFCSGD